MIYDSTLGSPTPIIEGFSLVEVKKMLLKAYKEGFTGPLDLAEEAVDKILSDMSPVQERVNEVVDSVSRRYVGDPNKRYAAPSFGGGTSWGTPSNWVPSSGGYAPITTTTTGVTPTGDVAYNTISGSHPPSLTSALQRARRQQQGHLPFPEEDDTFTL